MQDLPFYDNEVRRVLHVVLPLLPDLLLPHAKHPDHEPPNEHLRQAAGRPKPDQRLRRSGRYGVFFDLSLVIMTFIMATYGYTWGFYLSSAILLASVPLAIIIKER